MMAMVISGDDGDGVGDDDGVMVMMIFSSDD